MSSPRLRIASLNLKGNELSGAQLFRHCLQGEQVICLQEVDNVTLIRNQFRDYPYVYTTTNETTRGSKQQKSLMILSQVPFESTDRTLIQTDPGGDQWRRNAQHVVLKVTPSRSINLFHYHNTFNWQRNDWEFEKEGLAKFVNWACKKREIRNLGEASNLVFAGDFNITGASGGETLLQGLSCYSDNTDYVCSSFQMPATGSYETKDTTAGHNALWAELDATLDIDAVVGPEVTIYNLMHNEFLYAAETHTFDRDRRRVFTWRGGVTVTGAAWRLEPASMGSVRIFNTHQLEYLYAANYQPLDEDRRQVFTWRRGSPVNNDHWQIEDRGARGMRIFNTGQREYLYAANHHPFDDDNRYVFTWRPRNPISQGFWRIE